MVSEKLRQGAAPPGPPLRPALFFHTARSAAKTVRLTSDLGGRVRPAPSPWVFPLGVQNNATDPGNHSFRRFLSTSRTPLPEKITNFSEKITNYRTAQPIGSDAPCREGIWVTWSRSACTDRLDNSYNSNSLLFSGQTTHTNYPTGPCRHHLGKSLQILCNPGAIVPEGGGVGLGGWIIRNFFWKFRNILDTAISRGCRDVVQNLGGRVRVVASGRAFFKLVCKAPCRDFF